jgi:hypothetical protein
MNASTPLYLQLLGFFRQYSRARDWRHLKTLSWMVSALIGSGKLSLSAWEPYVTSQATQAQSFERRWRRFLTDGSINALTHLHSVGNGSIESMEKPAIVFSHRHDSVVG